MFNRLLKFIKINTDSWCKTPTRAHPDDAGLDLYASNPFTLFSGESKTICSGVRVIIPKGYVGLVLPKSGLASRDIVPVTGVIDSGYTGKIKVRMRNLGERPVAFASGEKIAQLVLLPIITPMPVETLACDFPDTERGENGFGSTGK